MKFQAHRGVSSEYPENTMPAFYAAWEQGYHVLEIDPRFTSDGQCVAFHDNTINRTCRTADGKEIEEKTVIEDVSWDMLKTLDPCSAVSRGNNQFFAGCRSRCDL